LVLARLTISGAYPQAFVGKADPFFAFPIRAGNRPVHVDKSFFEKAGPLHFPDRKASAVETFLQAKNIRWIEAPREIPGGGGIRNPLGLQSIEKAFILAALLDIFQAYPASQDVISDIQNVIALVIRQVDFQQLQMAIDLRRKSQALHHQMNRTDPSAAGGLRSLRHFIMDVAGPEHRAGLIAPVFWSQAALNPGLAVSENFAVGSTHSK
jgi:hypothetical protein